MKKSKIFVIALVQTMSLAVLSSCEKETLHVGSALDNITLSVTTVDLDTKSPDQAQEELVRTIVVDEDSLLLQEFVSDNLSLPFTQGPDTKGTVVGSSNIATVYGQFGMEIFIDNYDEIDPAESFNEPVMINDDQYVSGGTVAYASNAWNFTNGSGDPYKWLWEMKHIFWSYAPQTHSGTFSYGSKGSRKTMAISNYTSPTAAADQKDLLIAYNYQPYGESNRTETVNVNFRHALSDIYFDVSGVEDGTVTKIEIIGAYSQGNCAIAGDDLDDTDVTKAFTWSSLSTPATFAMTSGFGTGDSPDHFFMIPQTLPSGAKLKITMDGTTTKEVAFPATWKPGKYYQYKLTYDGATYDFKLTTTGAGTQSFTGKSHQVQRSNMSI